MSQFPRKIIGGVQEVRQGEFLDTNGDLEVSGLLWETASRHMFVNAEMIAATARDL